MVTPNQITLIRVFLAMAAIGLFHGGATTGSAWGPYLSLAGLGLLVVTIFLDAVDGYVARRRGQSSVFGATFDIAADRMVESMFWIYFAAVGLISFWLPVIVIARGGFTDFLRAIALAEGQTAFGEKTMMRTWWGRMLVGSRGSRAAYGIVKCAAFVALGGWLTLSHAPRWQAMLTAGLMQGVRAGALLLAGATVAFCLVRGIPVLIEGARFFRREPVAGRL